MNISISPDVMSPTISPLRSGSRPPPPPGEGGIGGPPAHASAIETMGSTTDEVKDSLLAGVVQLDESGASFEEIKSFVNSELEANSVDVSGGHQRSGQLVDMMS
jgi:hypothetical protein